MVEIRIDTKRDSDEEIRKTIRYLQHLVGEGGLTNAPAETPPPADGMFGMFDSSPESSEAPSEAPVEREEDDAFIQIVEY